MRVGCVLWLVVGVVLSVACPSMAAFSGLIIIPTADTIPDNAYELQLQSGGSLTRRTTTLQFFNTELGFGDRVEAGLDFGNSGDSSGWVFGNAKYAFAVDKKHELRLAAGMSNSLPVAGSVPYIVASKWLGIGPRLHVGIQRDDGATHLFVGADMAVDDRWVFMIDHTSGGVNYSSVGFNYMINDRSTIQVGVLIPNTGGETLYGLEFAYGGRFRR